MMTDTILRIQLNELKTVRILCRQKDCRGVIEIPLEEMAGRRAGLDHCPLCAAQFSDSFPDGEHLFMQLAQVVGKLKNVKAFALEFPIKVEK